MPINSGMMSSVMDDWSTPPEFFKRVNDEFNFTLDVCASECNAKCEKYFTESDDGLRKEWVGICWMNPPYGRDILDWMEKAYSSWRKGAVVVCLVPCRTDTVWWHSYVMRAPQVRLIRGRLKFGGSKNSAPFPCALVVFKGEAKRRPSLFSMYAYVK